jgi:hypothetical protein
MVILTGTGAKESDECHGKIYDIWANVWLQIATE